MIDFNKENLLLLEDLEEYKDDLKGSQGIYSIWCGTQCIYIGSSNNLWQRLNTHKRASITKSMREDSKRWKCVELYEFINRYRPKIEFTYILTPLLEAEEGLIALYKPRFNIQGVYSKYRKPKVKQVGFDWS